MRKIVSIGILVSVLLVWVAASKKPVTMFMVGDSTMADKTELDISPERGWGQLLPTYLKGRIVVQNHAMNGRSTKSFVDEGRWAEVLRRAHKGDIVVLQFGHNDAKVSDPKRYASVEDYTRNLTRMINEAQAQQLHVILCTPVCRRYFKKGEFYLHHGDYPKAAREVAQATNVPLIDMEQLTQEWLIGLGDEASKAYFMNVPAGECIKFPEGKTDNTHYRENGAMAAAGIFVQALAKANIKWVKPYLNYRPNAKPVYSTFCRPDFKSDKTVKVESDMKSFKE
ncbi:MAG: rhamnogalacturonan acetylesterase [Paludibacteraceae bacterium]|nr:rhamnogalacturonan acetylesterase [Paludibacteraceae bacterium]